MAAILLTAALPAIAAGKGAGSLRIGDSTRNGDHALRHAALIFALKHNVEITINRVSAETAVEKLRAGDFAMIVADQKELPSLPEFIAEDHCYEALAAYVHPANACRELTIHQLRDIIRKPKITWQKINGDRADIHRFSVSDRAANPGLMEKMFPAPASASFTRLNSVEEVLLMVADNPVAIGIAPMAISLPANVAAVRIGKVQPTLQTVRQNKYPLTVRYRRVMKKTPSAPEKKFLDYLHSLEFDRILLDNGMIPPETAKVSGR